MASMRRRLFMSAALLAAGSVSAEAAVCDKPCLERIGAQYRDAYLAQDPQRAPLAAKVRFTENNVEMPLPDGSWDTVTREIGPAVMLSDPRTGNIGVYTSIMQNETPGFLAVRLRVRGMKIVEVEHVIATNRYLAPPVTIGDVVGPVIDPDFARAVPHKQRAGRAELIRLANGYFSTLENNDGTLRGLQISPEASRRENGTAFPDVLKGFRNGFYRFNSRVRDRDFFLVDEVRGVVMARAFIDHKGQVDRYTLIDGSTARSPYQEPQTWGLLECFKIRGGEITAIGATFVQLPYYMRSPWKASGRR